MIDILKKTFDAGIGAAELTKEKAEKLAKELAAKGRVSEGELKKFVDDLLEKSHKQKEKFDASLAKAVEGVIKKMSLVSRSDLEAMEKRLIEKIEERK